MNWCTVKNLRQNTSHGVANGEQEYGPPTPYEILNRKQTTVQQHDGDLDGEHRGAVEDRGDEIQSEEVWREESNRNVP